MFKTNSRETNRERKIVNYQPWKICVCRARAIPTYDTFSTCFLSFFLFALDFPIAPSRPVSFFLMSMRPLEKNLDYKIWFVRTSIWDIFHYSENSTRPLRVFFFLHTLNHFVSIIARHRVQVYDTFRSRQSETTNRKDATLFLSLAFSSSDLRISAFSSSHAGNSITKILLRIEWYNLRTARKRVLPNNDTLAILRSFNFSRIQNERINRSFLSFK